MELSRTVCITKFDSVDGSSSSKRMSEVRFSSLPFSYQISDKTNTGKGKEDYFWRRKNYEVGVEPADCLLQDTELRKTWISDTKQSL